MLTTTLKEWSRLPALGLLAAALGLGLPGMAAAAPTKKPAADDSAAGGMCIPPETPKAVTTCPSNAPKQSTKKASTAPASMLREAKRKKEEPAAKGPSGPSIQIDAATLRNRENLELRAKKLLVKEIQITQRLIKNSRTNHPQRPEYLLRLAESFFELGQQQNAEIRKLDEPIYQACKVKKDAGRCKQLRDAQKKAEQSLAGYREENIRTLAVLVQDHSDFRRMDEVLFSLGFALEEMKQFERARQVYHRLIKGYPQSRFIPNAYLSFAEYYFVEGDMGAAQTFYQKVTEIPPDRNAVYGYAIYKQAWCAYNLDDFRGSLQKFVETIEYSQQNPKAKDAKNLAKQSRREMVMPYAQIGNPSKALEFFSRYAENTEQAYELVEKLAELYYDTGTWGSTIATYHRLMSEKPSDDRVCYWQTRVTNAVISSSAKPKQVTETERLVDLYEAYMSGQHAEAARNECKQAAASVLIDLATAWHREAIGTDTQPGTNDRGTMDMASKLYRLVLDKFPDMEQMEFPDIDRRDWPTEYRVSYFYAELLWKMENWDQCGPAFDRVVEVNPQGELTADAAYAAVLCYNNLYQQAYSGGERALRSDKSAKKGKRGKKQAEEEDNVAKFAVREHTELETGMLNAFQRYICFVPDSDDLATIKYRRARIYYESNHYEEAAVLFKDIAFNHQDSDLAVYAANLYLDSLNVVGSYRDPKRPACYDEMNDSIEPLHGQYCATDAAREDNQDLCTVLEQLRCDLLRKKAETHQEQELWKKAAGVYVGIFRRYPECGRLDEVLYNAAINFEAARLLGRAIKVRKVLIDRYQDSEWAKRAVYLVGANYHALAMYDKAAEYYETFARRFPSEDGSKCTEQEVSLGTCAVAHDALQNAIFFRLGLGDEAKAVEHASLFERNYKRRFPQETSQVVYSLGSIYERQEDWQKLIAHFKNYLRTYGKRAMPHEVLSANVQIGRAYWKLNDKRNAQVAFRSAIQTWQRGAPEQIAKSDLPDDKKERNLASAKISTAEALFYEAEMLFDAFRSVKFPAYKAGKQKDAFEKWMEKDFVNWMKAKEAALTTAREGYEKISELEVPQWDIAAAARVGEMYRQFVDDFRDAPVPPVLQSDDELVDIYYQSLDEHSKPWVDKAKDAYEFCLITATRVRWFNEFMSQCEQELFKLDPRRYPRAAELRAGDRYVHSAKAIPGPVTLATAGDEDDAGGEE
jgi:tetratricopeptide (TPR) repeat protein